MINHLFGSQTIRLSECKCRKTSVFCLHHHSRSHEQPHKHSPFSKQRMPEQSTEFPTMTDKHPQHGNTQQNISCIRNSYSPRIIIHRQPAPLLIIIKRRLVKTISLTREDTIHGNRFRTTDIADIICRSFRPRIILHPETVQTQCEW